MANNSEKTKKELTEEDLRNVSGGNVVGMTKCPFCGEILYLADIKQHLINCDKNILANK